MMRLSMVCRENTPGQETIPPKLVASSRISYLHGGFDIKKLTAAIGTFMMIMLAVCGSTAASTEEKSGDDSTVKEDWYIGPRIGISPFTGVIGLEIQYHNFALSGGIPGNVGLKYYFKPDGHSLFLGGYFLHFKNDSNDLPYGGFDGDTTWTEGGLGFGHRWRWGSGWDLSLCAAIAYGEKEETTGPAWRKTKYIGFRPGIAVGYSF